MSEMIERNDLNADISLSLKVRGWATGGYVCFCHTCGQKHTAAKGAKNCLHCALKDAGYVIVPREPTPEMMQTIKKIFEYGRIGADEEKIKTAVKLIFAAIEDSE